MRLIESRYLDDGKLFNDGRAARLIRIDQPSDFDQLLSNIETNGYYGRAYFENHLGYREDQLRLDALLIASLVLALKPDRVLELGCGRGDVLFVLQAAGVKSVRGLDISQAAVDQARPEVRDRLIQTDLLTGCRELAVQGRKYDLILALDIWEHLAPDRLGRYIDAAAELLTDDGLIFTVLPAVGPDPVFGELFPLEFEENRADLAAGRMFSYLLAEEAEPPLPAQGHLIMAPWNWWQAAFADRDLIRDRAIETSLHDYYDPLLGRAQRAFFVLRPSGHRPSSPALTGRALAKAFRTCVESVRKTGPAATRPTLDQAQVRAALNYGWKKILGPALAKPASRLIRLLSAIKRSSP